MKQKLLWSALIILIIAQLLVPFYGIVRRLQIIATGSEYKLKIRLYDPYDAFRGRYVRISIDGSAVDSDSCYFSHVQDSCYGHIAVGADGFARIERDERSTSTADNNFIKSSSNRYFTFPLDRYYLNEKLAPRAETLLNRTRTDGEAYIIVRVKNGEVVITDLYYNGERIEDYLRRQTNSNHHSSSSKLTFGSEFFVTPCKPPYRLAV